MKAPSDKDLRSLESSLRLSLKSRVEGSRSRGARPPITGSPVI